MILKQIDERHFKQIAHDFYGNQYSQARRRKLKRKERIATFKAVCVMGIMLTVLTWKSVMAVEAYFNPPIISPIPTENIVKDTISPHNISIKPLVLHPTTIPIAPTHKKSIVGQKTANIQQHTIVQQDDRVTKLATFLAKRNSPLQYYATEIVQLADYYAIDYTLVPAIAGKESGFGLNIKPDSYNAWGVMAWTNGKRHIRSFTSWSDGITFETKLLAENYKLNANEAIGEKYCPKTECSQTWASDVTEFSQAINQN